MDVLYTDRMVISSSMSQYEFKKYKHRANIFIMIAKCIEFTAARGFLRMIWYVHYI